MKVSVSMVRLLVPKQMMIRLGCMTSTISGMAISPLPTKCSHLRLVMFCTPALTTPTVFSMVVKCTSELSSGP